MTEKAAELDLGITETDEGLEALGSLESKIALTVAQMKKLRADNEGLREENSDLERRVADQDVQLKDLRGRLARLESDRVNVKSRVQRLIEEVDAVAGSGD
jgi:FtsZ-binding cell division protein ZapB